MKTITKARPSALWQYGIAITTVLLVSLLNEGLQRWTGYEALALTYLLAIVLLALFVGRGPVLFAAAFTAVGWSFLFAPPRNSFHIQSLYDQKLATIYFVVALTIAQVIAQLRSDRAAEHAREERSRALYLLTRDLAEATDSTDVVRRGIGQIRAQLDCEAAVLLPSASYNGALSVQDPATWDLPEEAELAASELFENMRSTGRTAPTRSDLGGLFLPLSTGRERTGVLAMRWERKIESNQSDLDLLENIAQQIGMALERQRLRDAELRTRLLTESERLGRTLLNSVSHELRTPLAAITSAASSLHNAGPLTGVQEKLAVEIESAGTRLNRVVDSLLSAARIQAGLLRPALDWCDLSDVVRAAVRDTAKLIVGHPIETRVAARLPLVKADFVLMEQALSNLLVNAATHTPPASPIEISIKAQEKNVVVEVSDYGSGLPPGQLERVFDLFHREPNAKPGGTGLGLAIVKGFVEAQGGQVWAANRPDGGATFGLSLPVGDAPEIPEEIS